MFFAIVKRIYGYVVRAALFMSHYLQKYSIFTSYETILYEKIV